MTVGSTVIDGADASNYALDLPSLFALIRFSGARWNQDGYHTTADDTAATHPVQAGFDGSMAYGTKPASEQQVWFYSGTLATGHTSVDAFFLHVNALGGAVNVTVQLSDSATNVGDTTISNVDADYLRTAKRMFMPCLQVSGDSGDTQRRFIGVIYFKVKFDAGVGNTCQPVINEVACGLQRQLGNTPVRPWYWEDRDDLTDDFTSAGGLRTSYNHARGLYVLDGTWRVYDATQRQRWVDFNADLHGKYPFIFARLPKSNPFQSPLMCRRSPGFRLPRPRPSEWEVTLSAVEQGGWLLGDE